MAKYTPSKSYEKWSNGYYGDYGNSKYGNSSFWLDDDFGKSFTEGGGVDTIKMMSYQRAIGNFVRILLSALILRLYTQPRIVLIPMVIQW